MSLPCSPAFGPPAFGPPAFGPPVPLLPSLSSAFSPAFTSAFSPAFTSAFSPAFTSARTRPARTRPALSASHPQPHHHTQQHQHDHHPSAPSRPALPSSTIRVATARAITPTRRPADPHRFTEMQPLPSQRRTDLMAPKSLGFWSFLPYMAASAVVLASAWLANKRFTARQAALVREFGHVIVLYGNTPDAKREIASEYKRKLGPAILRGAMFASYLAALVADRPIVPATIHDVQLVKKLLRLGDQRAVKAINKLAATFSDSPSLLGKLLFIAERIIHVHNLPALHLVPLFPYSADTVADLQRNMLERCYLDYVAHQIDHNHLQQPPLAAAAALRLDHAHAKLLFDRVLQQRLKQRQQEAAKEAAADAEHDQESDREHLDYVARSGEPAKANVHAYQCTDCGYTLFPAAGREFKFYGDDFVCPACGAPKDRFVDVNADE